MKLREIADRLGCRLAGDGDLEISGVAGMEHAGPGQLTFLANPKYGPKVKHTQASAILVGQEIPGVEIAFLISENPYLDFARALALYYQPPESIRWRMWRRAPWWERTARSDPSRWWASAFGWAAMPCFTPTWSSMKGRKSATISWRIRTQPCASSAGSAA